MSQLSRLKEARNLSNLASLLGFTPKGLSYVLYRIPDAKKYRVFDIPKKNGATRTIKAPTDQLALLQARLNEFLSSCVEELLGDNPRYWYASHGFRKGRTILSNANAHRKKRYVFNVDIADFFGTINFGRVRGFFVKDKSFAVTPAVATVIAQIACHENSLPQGSPCSPVISNLVASILDARLLRLAKTARCTYTRYADDLTFSTNSSIFPSEIASEMSGAGWAVGKRLQKEIKGSGFTLNPDKTRMSLRRSRQMVTGLVVNEKPNVSQNYYRTVRAMCDSVFRTGTWHRPVQAEGGEPRLISNLKPLEGMLSHVYFVKVRRDQPHNANKKAKDNPLRGLVELYREFLFYKHFVANNLPMIVTEGVSDITYIMSAIRSLAAKFPTLATVKGGKVGVDIGFLPPSSTSRSVLKLVHGTAGQQALVEQYDKRLKRYRYRPLLNPVIILCDNDEGSKEVFKAAKKNCNCEVSITATNPFYHLGHNLYLVKVTEGEPAGPRDIEDLFPKSCLTQMINGKPFDKKKNHEDSTAYGKVVFANKIIRPNVNDIDFTPFEGLLRRIEACITHYSYNTAPTENAPVSAAAVMAF